MEFKDYYDILGVSPDATGDDIKRAFRRLARKYHPDVSTEAGAEDRYKEIGEAYEVLKDPEKRAAYDRLRQRGYRGGESFEPPPDWDFETHFGGGGFTGADESAFSDFFETLFGRAAGAGAGPFRGARVHRTAFRARGEDLHARLTVTLEEAFHGTTREVTLQSAEPNDQGVLVPRRHTLRVKVPAGVTHGAQIRLRGQGQPGLGGGPPGDLYLEIALEPHRLFQVEGHDVILHLPVAPWEAALGATVQVPTLAGEVEMKVPPGSQNGRRLRLKGRGLPGRPPGDQYVVLRIEMPPRVSDKARELYRELAREQPFDPRERLRR